MDPAGKQPKKRMSVSDRRASFNTARRRPNPVGAQGTSDRRASTEYTTQPLVGRSVLQEERLPTTNLPLGAYPKGATDPALSGEDEATAARRAILSAKSSVAGSRASGSSGFHRKHSQSLPTNDDARQPTRPDVGRRQSTAQLYAPDGMRLSRMDLRRPSAQQYRRLSTTAEGRHQSLSHTSSDWRHPGRPHAASSDAPSVEPNAYALERTTASSIYGKKPGKSHRSSSTPTATLSPSVSLPSDVSALEVQLAPPLMKHSSLTSIGNAEDVDITSVSSDTTIRSVQEQRYMFESRSEHFLVFFCYCLGFENMWVFTNFDFDSDSPTIVHHVIAYIGVAMPMIYMELFIGQYTQRAVLMFGRIVPLAHGFGWAVLVYTIYSLVGTTLSMGDAFFYFIVSFAGTPWMDCQTYKTENFKINGTCLGADLMKKCLHSLPRHPKMCHNRMVLSATVFLESHLIHRKPNPRLVLGGIRIGRLCCALIAWILVTLTTLMGFVQYKKILQMGCVFIVACLSILLIMLLASESEYMIHSIEEIFHIHKGSLTSLKAWTTAITFALMEVNLCRGGHMLFGSFMDPKTEGDLDAILFVIATLVANFLGSIFSQLVVHALQVKHAVTIPPIERGKRVLFTAVPQGLGTMQVPQLLSIIYFGMLFVAMLLNQVVQLDVITESIIDALPKMTVYRKYMVSLFGATGFILTMPYVTGIGNQLQLELEHGHMVRVFLMLNLVEAVCVFWLYGSQKFSDDIHFLLGAQPTLVWKIFWRASPILLLLTLLYCVPYISEEERADFVLSVKIMAIVYAVVCVSPLLIGAIYKCLKYLQYHNLAGVLKSENEWGHPDAHERLMRHIYNPRHQTRSRRRDATCKHRCLKESSVLKQLALAEAIASDNMEIAVEGNEMFKLHKNTATSNDDDNDKDNDNDNKPGTSKSATQ